ncbi:MAG TPA: hypothetical protein VN325_23210 [Steroidobacteraceae bacterium]|nr:hypothetical protein [Steroidobacteraceae bacterium]
MTTRRGFITGLGALFIAAPAIVRVASIMPVRAFDLDLTDYDAIEQELRAMSGGIEHSVRDAFGELVSVTRMAFVPRLFVEVYRASPLLAELQGNADS